jgi:protein disulfide isomerase family A protein 3
VTIAAMDATAHDVPKGYDVQGYPTVLFIPANTKKAISFDEERDAESMISFINSHRTTAKSEL